MGAGLRLSELAGIRCHPGDLACSDPDLHSRQIRVRGKGPRPSRSVTRRPAAWTALV